MIKYYKLISESYDMITDPKLYIKTVINKADKCILILKTDLTKKKRDLFNSAITYITYRNDIKKIINFKEKCQQLIISADDTQLKKFIADSYFKKIESLLNRIILTGYDVTIN